MNSMHHPLIACRSLAIILGLCATLPSVVLAGSKEVVVPSPASVPSGEPGWQFAIKPYAWAMGLDGTVGLGGLNAAVDMDSMEVLENLNMAFFLQAEARNGRWGILFDGFFAEISGSGTPTGNLYSQADIQIQQGLAELAVAYRVLEGPSGFLDVFAGARYNSLQLDVAATINESGLRQASQLASNRIVSEVGDRAESAITRRLTEIRAAAESKLESIRQDLRQTLIDELKDRVVTKLSGIGSGSGGALSRTDLIKAIQSHGIQGPWRDYVKAAVEARVAAVRAETQSIVADAQSIAAEARNAVQNRAQKRLAAAEKKLAKAIESEFRSRLTGNRSAEKNWVDPLVGFRAQWNITEAVYLAGRADIGGFGVGSQLTWQASAALGYQFNEHWSLETGYRYMDIDYADGPFSLDLNEGGAFLAARYSF